MGGQRVLGSSYVLEEVLSSGASGQVWRGRDRADREWAVKLLRQDLAADDTVVRRFLQERSVLASIRHPNVVGVHDLVIEGSTLAIVMDLVAGEDLRATIRAEGPLVPELVATWGAQIASGLSAAHDLGVVHRDVKPENVLIDAVTQQARLTDFGIAKIRDAAHGRTTMLGTPHYLAPEVACGLDPSPAADLYSLGATLYEMCCGVAPFADRGTPMAMLWAHVTDVPGRPEGVPEPLWTLIADLLEKDPARRPPSATAVADYLQEQADSLSELPAAPALRAPPPAVPASVPPAGPPTGTDASSTITVDHVPAATGEHADATSAGRSPYIGASRDAAFAGRSVSPPVEPPSVIGARPARPRRAGPMVGAGLIALGGMVAAWGTSMEWTNDGAHATAQDPRAVASAVPVTPSSTPTESAPPKTRTSARSQTSTSQTRTPARPRAAVPAPPAPAPEISAPPKTRTFAPSRTVRSQASAPPRPRAAVPAPPAPAPETSAPPKTRTFAPSQTSTPKTSAPTPTEAPGRPPPETSTPPKTRTSAPSQTSTPKTSASTPTEAPAPPPPAPETSAPPPTESETSEDEASRG